MATANTVEPMSKVILGYRVVTVKITNSPSRNTFLSETKDSFDCVAISPKKFSGQKGSFWGKKVKDNDRIDIWSEIYDMDGFEHLGNQVQFVKIL